MTNEIKCNLPYKLDLQMFAEDPPVDPPAIPPVDPPADPPKKLELTQEEFDAKIAERLARERKKYVDYDELKTKLTALEQAEEERKKAAMSEQERLQTEKDAAEKKALEAEESAQKVLTSANQRLIKAEFKALAREAGVRADALEDAFKLAELTTVSVDDDGNVEGVSDVITALVAAKPYLAEPTKKEPRNIGGGNNPDPKPDKTKEQLLTDAADKARKTGRIEDRMAYAALKEELNK